MISYQSRSFLILLFLCLTALFWQACRKLDHLGVRTPPEDHTEIINRFLNIPANIDPSIRHVLRKIETHKDSIPAFVKRYGYAVWDKSIVSTAGSNSGRTQLTSSDGNSSQEKTRIVVPLVIDGDQQVKTALVASIDQLDSVRMMLLRSGDYKWYDDNPSVTRAGGEWWLMEQDWASKIQSQINITDIKIEIEYGTNNRPIRFVVDWRENGVPIPEPYFFNN